MTDTLRNLVRSTCIDLPCYLVTSLPVCAFVPHSRSPSRNSHTVDFTKIYLGGRNSHKSPFLAPTSEHTLAAKFIFLHNFRSR